MEQLYRKVTLTDEDILEQYPGYWIISSNEDNVELGHICNSGMKIDRVFYEPVHQSATEKEEVDERALAVKRVLWNKIKSNEDKSWFHPVDVVRAVTGFEDLIAALLKEIADNDASFDLRWHADRRADKMWQEKTGKHNTMPDHADLCVFLLQKVDGLTAENRRLKRDTNPSESTTGKLAAHVEAFVKVNPEVLKMDALKLRTLANFFDMFDEACYRAFSTPKRDDCQKDLRRIADYINPTDPHPITWKPLSDLQ